MKRLAHRVCGPAILVGLLIVSLLSGCRHSSDPSLAAADSLMEEHPDSALMMLNEYPSGTPTSKADSAYYALLLTHARYKNFIDETDDSLISSATDYFLDHDDKGKASRALFLQGMIRMNSNRLGEAAVSFRKGLDIAREGKQYMWEGQCARGLFAIYGQLYDGSAQLQYAKQALVAFENTNDKGWTEYAKLNLARAYNNNGSYQEADSIANVIITDNVGSEVLSEVYILKAVSSYGIGKFEEALRYYFKAYEIVPTILSTNDRQNISVALAEISSVPDNKKLDFPLDVLSAMSHSSLEDFSVLASEERYQEAYASLEQYKNMQDSVLSVIIKNDVAESVNQYEELTKALNDEKEKNRKSSYWIIILLILIVASIIVWRYRERIHKEKLLRVKSETDLESLRADFKIQLEKVKDLAEKSVECPASSVSDDFMRIIRQQYAQTNKLFDDYYQGRISKSERERADEEIQQIVKDFTKSEGVEKIGRYIDEQSRGMYSSFQKDFFYLTEEDKLLFLYLTLGFSPRSIAVIIGYETKTVYNRKTRLKAKIENSDVSGKEKYLKAIQRTKD